MIELICTGMQDGYGDIDMRSGLASRRVTQDQSSASSVSIVDRTALLSRLSVSKSYPCPLETSQPYVYGYMQLETIKYSYTLALAIYCTSIISQQVRRVHEIRALSFTAQLGRHAVTLERYLGHLTARDSRGVVPPKENLQGKQRVSGSTMRAAGP